MDETDYEGYPRALRFVFDPTEIEIYSGDYFQTGTKCPGHARPSWVNPDTGKYIYPGSEGNWHFGSNDCDSAPDINYFADNDVTENFWEGLNFYFVWNHLGGSSNIWISPSICVLPTGWKHESRPWKVYSAELEIYFRF